MDSPLVRTALSPGLCRVGHEPEGCVAITSEENTSPRHLQRDALYAEFSPLIRRLIRKYGTDPEIRADLVGEIYTRFCDLYERFDPGRGVPLRPYIARQLTWSIHTFCRAYWRQRSRELPVVQEDGSTPEGPSGSADPTADALDHELCRVLSAAIGRLPERQRQALILRYYDSKSFDEIGVTLSVQPATARSLLRNAIANLRIEPLLRGYAVVRVREAAPAIPAISAIPAIPAIPAGRARGGAGAGPRAA
jgi:RNA polymerase sigma-70 factor (ECF subfamily)